MTKQTTIVVIGTLRVKYHYSWFVIDLIEEKMFVF